MPLCAHRFLPEFKQRSEQRSLFSLFKFKILKIEQKAQFFSSHFFSKYTILYLQRQQQQQKINRKTISNPPIRACYTLTQPHSLTHSHTHKIFFVLYRYN